MQHISPKELTAQAAWHPHRMARDYHDARMKAEEIAASAIRDYAAVFRTTPEIALLRIARDATSGATRDLIAAVVELLDVTDPDDFDGAVDWLHKATDDYSDTFR